MIAFIVTLGLAVLLIAIAIGVGKLLAYVHTESEDAVLLKQLTERLQRYAEDSDENSVEVLERIIRERRELRAQLQAQARPRGDSELLSLVLRTTLPPMAQAQPKLPETNPTVWEHLDGDDV